MTGTVSGPVPVPVVKSVPLTVAVQEPLRVPRRSVTVTGPIWPAMLAEPDATDPMFTDPGALIVRPAVVIANVTVVSAAEAGSAVAATRPTAPASAQSVLRIQFIQC